MASSWRSKILTATFIFTSLLIVSFAYIDQTSAPDEVGKMTYDSNLVGSQYECSVLNAEGALTAFEVDFTFHPNGDSEAWAGDMFMLIQNSHPYGTPEHVCYQYGGYDDTVSIIP